MYVYWRKLAAKYDLYRRTVFNRTVVSAEWSAKEQLYHVITKDVKSGERFSTTAKIVISALGILEVPRFPDITGLSSFNGAKFHSARWDSSVALGGKRVAVIGNGASA
jgi:cation diffusion facilitator CzcD-associated flavoprotein CzcO